MSDTWGRTEHQPNVGSFSVRALGGDLARVIVSDAFNVESTSGDQTTSVRIDHISDAHYNSASYCIVL